MAEMNVEELLRSLKAQIERDEKKAKEAAYIRDDDDESATAKDVEIAKALAFALKTATVSTSAPRRVSVTPGGGSPSFGGGPVTAPPVLGRHARLGPDPVAVFLARLSPETQEVIRLDLIARLAGIMSGLSEHKETEERIADLEAFEMLADKIAETPDWASF